MTDSLADTSPLATIRPRLGRRRIPARTLTLCHSGLTFTGFYSMHLLGAIFPVTAAVLLYGWRALCVIFVVTGSAALAFAIWRRIGKRGRQMHIEHVLWMALLLSLMLPVHLLTDAPPFPDVQDSLPQLWMALVGGGMMVTMLSWLFLGSATGRIYPVLVSYLLLVVMFKAALVPHWVLQKQHLFVGDVRDSRHVNLERYPAGWRSIPDRPHFAGLYEPSPAEDLVDYTSGPAGAGSRYLSVDSLLRDAMPPLEDLILGSYPGPIGASSAIFVIVGGLFLLFRGVIDYRIPVLICITAFVTLLVLPIPAVVRPASAELAHSQILWRWLALRDHNVGPAVGITFANYEIMAGPLLFMGFFLATAPELRPMTRRGRFLFAIVIGLLAAALQLYISVSFGPYLALLIASLVTTGLDRFFRARCLI